MRGRIRTRDHEQPAESGFTLIELLVVIIIIGILAAIAIPIFLDQRVKAYNGTSQADIRDLAEFEEIYLNDNGRYGTIAEVQAAEPTLKVSLGVTLTVIRYDTYRGYCLSATHTGSTVVYYFDSQGGGLQPKGSTGCPVTLSGTPGDSVTG